MRRILVASLAVLVLGLSLAGCASTPTSVYVLAGDEIVPLSKGDTFTVPYDGCYYSLNAEKRVMDVRRMDMEMK